MGKLDKLVKNYGPLRAEIDETEKVIRLTRMNYKGDALPEGTIWRIITWAADDLSELLNSGYALDLSKAGVKEREKQHI